MLSTRSPGRLHLVLLDGAIETGVLPREDVRGLDVKDANAAAIGVVDDLVVDAVSGCVRFLKVGSGGLFGLGRDHCLVPVDVVDSVANATVFIRSSTAHVDAAPHRGDLNSEAYVGGIYRHFGCEPYWSDDYRAPDWTHRET